MNKFQYEYPPLFLLHCYYVVHITLVHITSHKLHTFSCNLSCVCDFSLSFRSHLFSLHSIFLSICYAVPCTLRTVLNIKKLRMLSLFSFSTASAVALPFLCSLLRFQNAIQFLSPHASVFVCMFGINYIYVDWLEWEEKRNMYTNEKHYIMIFVDVVVVLFLPLIVHITNRASTYTLFNICTKRPTHKEHMDNSVFVSFSYIFFNLKYKFSFHSVSSVVWCVFDCELNTEYLALILRESESIRE